MVRKEETPSEQDSGQLERELAALKAMVEALQPLDQEQRERALNYVADRLGIQLGVV